MACFFTADWHINDSSLITNKLRPFFSIEKMNSFILKNANLYAHSHADTIIHIGDLRQQLSYKDDEYKHQLSQIDITNKLIAQIICLNGNHDNNNNVKTIGKSLRISLGSQFNSVVCCHYPSTDVRAVGNFNEYDILIHGHCHSGVYNTNNIFYFDKKYNVLNVNVCIDLNHYQIWTEQELIKKIITFFKSNSIPL